MDRGGWHYPAGDFRVSDDDRDRALSELGQAFQAGRITGEELDQRSGQALAARTGRDLTALLADLPVELAIAARGTPLRGARHAVATCLSIAAGIAAMCFAATAAAAALSTGPNLPSPDLLSDGQKGGLVLPPSTGPGPAVGPSFDWADAIIPAAVAVLLVMMLVVLRVRIGRARRPESPD